MTASPKPIISGFNFFAWNWIIIARWAGHRWYPWWSSAWLTRPQFIPGNNTSSSSIWATLLTHLLRDEHPITEAHGEIALVLRGSGYWTADCSPNNILHMDNSKIESCNGNRTIKSGPQVNSDVLTQVIRHPFIWPHVVTAWAAMIRFSSPARVLRWAGICHNTSLLAFFSPRS